MSKVINPTLSNFMSRNYTAIHYIQDKLKDFNPKFVECVVRQFNMIDINKESDGCLSNSVVLYICAKEYGYNPKLCYGLCSYKNKDFYHAWLEINNIIIDLSFYGNVNFSLYSMWTKVDVPYIGSYKNSDVHYGKFEFDDDWKSSLISAVEGWSFIKYMDGMPQNAMWKILCKCKEFDSLQNFTNKINIVNIGFKPERETN